MPVNEYATHVRWHEGERLDHVFEARCDVLEQTFDEPLDAVIMPDASYSFRELDNLANQTARHLIASGVGNGDRVAMMFDKSVETYVALLAILKVNAAYVPLDCSFPTDRIAYIMEDAGVTALVSESEFEEKLRPFSQIKVFLDSDREAIWSYDNSRLREAEKGVPVSELAYIIYTSGTTGNPKGVVINHPSIVNFVRVAAEVYGYKVGDRVYQGLTIAFDFSVEEIWVPLIAGAVLVPAKRGTRLVGEGLADFLEEHKISAMCCVPTLLATIERDLPDLRLLLLSGEACPQGLVDRWATDERVILNAYGPTEATVTATITQLYPNKPVTIGFPLPTYQIVILAENEDVALPLGDTGEIGIAGIGLAEGYLNRDDLTSSKFIPDFLKLESNPSGRIYRSGDLGRINEEGEVECFGRIDTQVKIRGYRIELTEIESVIMDTPEVAQAVVDTYEFEEGLKELVAYYSLIPGASGICHAELAKKLRERLPKYMVPAYYEHLDVVPMTSSDKADRKKLPAPVGPRLSSASDKVVEPENEIEEILAATLSEILKIDQLSVEDDFFEDLGAHSLLMAQFCTKVRGKIEGVEISMPDVYKNPTVRKLAASLDLSAAPRFAVKNKRPYYVASDFEYYGTWALQTLYYVALIAFSTVVLKQVVGAIIRSDSLLMANLVGMAAALGAGIALAAFSVASKWVLIGRYQTVEIPVWSFGYFRFWLARELSDISPLTLFPGSPLLNVHLRLLGAKIGRRAVILCKKPPVCTDLIEIGDDAVLCSETMLNGYRAERGVIQMGRVKLGNKAFVGVGSLVDIETRMGDDTQLGHASTLQAGQVIPDGKHFHGTPAEETEIDYCPLPEMNCSDLRRNTYAFFQVANLLAFAVPIPVTFVYLLARYGMTPSVEQAFLSPFANFMAVTNILVVSFFLLGLLFICSIPRLLSLFIEDGKDYVLFGCHYGLAQFIDKYSNSDFYVQLFGDSPFITKYMSAIGWNLNKVYQTGTNFGTTQRHNNPALCEVGEKTMISDGINMVNTEISSTTFRQSKVEVGSNTYLGNDIQYPPRAKVGQNCLLGTKVLVPLDGPVRDNVGLLGSPAFEIPRATSRDAEYSKIDETERLEQVAKKGRFNIWTMVAFLSVKLAFVNLSALYFYWAWTLNTEKSSVVLTAAGVMFLVFTVLFYVMIERSGWGFKQMGPRICSVYDPYFWRIEHYWKLCEGFLEDSFHGTPFKPVIYRMLGAKIGKKVFDDGAFVSDKMLLEVGDYVTLNSEVVLQSHSLEEGVYKSDHIKIGEGTTVGTLGFVHYGVETGENCIIEGNAFLMKGENVGSGTIWEGNPAKEVTVERDPNEPVGSVPIVPLVGDGEVRNPAYPVEVLENVSTPRGDLKTGPVVYYGSVREILKSSESNNILTGGELERAATFGKIQDRNRFVAARVLLRRALSWSVRDDVAPDSWRFERGAHGKPALVSSDAMLKFSVAHCEGAVGVAISTNCEVGIDLERLDVLDQMSPIYEALSVHERTLVDELPEIEKIEYFIRLWTAKEAFSKAVGVGASIDFGQLDVDFNARTVRAESSLRDIATGGILENRSVKIGRANYSLSVATAVVANTGLDIDFVRLSRGRRPPLK